jgi:O-antigen ligase
MNTIDSRHAGEDWRTLVNVAVIVTLGLTVAVASVFPIIIVLLASAVFLWVAFRFPQAMTTVGAVAAVLVRPSLDRFGTVSLPGGNPASLFGGVMLVWGMTVGLARLYRGLSIWPNRRVAIPLAFLLVLHASLFVFGLAISRTGQLSVEVRELARFGSTFAAGMLAIWWQHDSRDRGWQPAILVIVIASMFPIAVGVVQALTGTGNHEDSNLNRVYGSFTHPLSYGPYLLPLVILGVAGITRIRGPARLLATAYTATAATLLFLTYNRTTMLLLFIGVALYAMMELAQVRLRDVVRFGGAIAALVIVGWLVFGGQISERFSGISITSGAIQEALTSGSQNSFQWRIVNWAILIQLGLSHPIVGHGLGMTTVLNPLIQASSGIPFNAHDDYVRFFFEGGLIGVALYSAFVATLALWLFRSRRSLQDADRSVGYAIIASLASLYVFSAGTTEMTLQTGVLCQTYLLIAILVGAESRREAAAEHSVHIQ